MNSNPSTILILGDGGWGTALAILANRSGHDARMWSYDSAYANHLARTRQNPKFLPGIDIPAEVKISSDFGIVAAEATFIFSVIPTQFLRSALASMKDFPPDALVVSCTKGIECGTLLFPSQIIAEQLGARPLVVLSGPSHAEEVARGLPASVVAASSDLAAARKVSELLSGPTFRVYPNQDPAGVEISSAVKNVMALATGIADGLGLGDNTRAAIITRGAAEIARLGSVLNAQRETFNGLAGMGDLIVTCTSTHSRNHSVGYRIGCGETLDLILRSTEKVPEGVETTRSLLELSRLKGVEMPITSEVHSVLFENKNPRDAVQSLMARVIKEEG